MKARFLGILFVCWTTLTVSQCSFVLAGSKEGRIGIEHTVTEDDAKAAARILTPELMVGVGCKNCSRSELAYCDSQDVINDHCCCDRRYHETFPYIAHTCYLEDRHCQTFAPHCGEFARLVLCCCHRLLASKWKKIASSSHTAIPGLHLIRIVLTITMAFGYF